MSLEVPGSQFDGIKALWSDSFRRPLRAAVGPRRQLGPVVSSRPRSARLPRAGLTAAPPRTADIRAPAVARSNGCLMADNVSSPSVLDWPQPLQLRRSLTKRAPLIHSLCRSPHTGSGTNFEGSDCPTH